MKGVEDLIDVTVQICKPLRSVKGKACYIGREGDFSIVGELNS